MYTREQKCQGMYGYETRRKWLDRNPWGKHEVAGWAPVGRVGNSKSKINKWKFQKEMFEDVHDGEHMKGMVH